MDNEKEISFGAFDSELMHQEIFIPEGFTATIDGDKIILKKKESEDERVRKIILDQMKCWNEEATKENCEIDIEASSKCIAWLEKQGEQKPIDKIQLGKKYKCIASPRYSTFRRGNIYKPVDNFLCNLMNLCYECFEPIEDSEQKSSDEDMKEALRTEYEKGRADAFAQMQKEWSEEDERMIANIRDDLFCYQTEVRDEDHQLAEDIEKEIKWLKSLKDRYTWKPSDAQIRALEYIINNAHNTSYSCKIAKELLEQLRKLKGE